MKTNNKESRRVFDALHRIDKDITRSANQALLDYAFEREVFDNEEYLFYSSIWRAHRGSLTPGLDDWKRQLNEKLLEAFKVEKLPKGRGY